jgi:hypothetical protein
MLFQPSFPNITAVPQYSQLITISPNFGVIGAPQWGHLSALASKGAMTGVDGTCCTGKLEILAPHFIQNNASSGSCAPHLGQYKVTTFTSI